MSLDRPISLDDIIPEDSSITLDGKEYKLRAINLADRAWMNRKFGPDHIKEVFEKLLMEEICTILFHQLEDKSDFEAHKVETYDDDGVKTTVLQTGPQTLMSKITSIKHQIEVIQTLMKLIGFSEPILDDLEQKQVEEEAKKKPPKQTGAESLTQ